MQFLVCQFGIYVVSSINPEGKGNGFTAVQGFQPLFDIRCIADFDIFLEAGIGQNIDDAFFAHVRAPVRNNFTSEHSISETSVQDNKRKAAALAASVRVLLLLRSDFLDDLFRFVKEEVDISWCFAHQIRDLVCCIPVE